MDPDKYNGSADVVRSSTLHTVDNEIRSSSRRHHQKKRHSDRALSSSGPGISTDSQDERIEVKILPQDENWGETTTITCDGGNENTATYNYDTSLQLDDNYHTEHLQHLSNNLNRRILSIPISQFFIYLLCLIAFISPIFFLSLPYTLVTPDSLPINDYSLTLAITFKLIILFLGAFLLLYRRRKKAYLPRIHLQKTCLIIILLSLILVYWFYYIFKLLKPNVDKYERILFMTSAYEDLLLFLLIISIFILEIKWLYPRWIVKVVRSPDGQARRYTVGRPSHL